MQPIHPAGRLRYATCRHCRRWCCDGPARSNGSRPVDRTLASLGLPPAIASLGHHSTSAARPPFDQRFARGLRWCPARTSVPSRLDGDHEWVWPNANPSHMAAVMSGVQRSGLWKLIRTLAYREVTIRTYAGVVQGRRGLASRRKRSSACASAATVSGRNLRPRCAPSQGPASWRMSFIIRAISGPQVHRLSESHRPLSEPRGG